MTSLHTSEPETMAAPSARTVLTQSRGPLTTVLLPAERLANGQSAKGLAIDTDPPLLEASMSHVFASRHGGQVLPVRHRFVDPTIECLDRCVEELDAGLDLSEQDAVVIGREPAGEGLGELGDVFFHSRVPRRWPEPRRAARPWRGAGETPTSR